ncbi:hypothetical protein [Eubacterium sp.]|uniref:hypothetical protein n=1 Tax=Eubacterium sp. TaxID=142586 RepID=UPI0025CE0719|nr:hypothetical protein [Eubacterium sp.]MCR5629800.1 hypothetical protein [Eubacterium sp.]
MAGLVSCGPKRSLNTKDTTTKTNKTQETTTSETITSEATTEIQTEQPTEDFVDESEIIQANFFNYLDNQNHGELLKTKASKEVLSVISSIKKANNLVNRYKIGDEDKTKEITPLFELNSDDEIIKYLGDNTWSFQVGDEVSIYKPNDSKEATLPCAFLAAELCIPYAFSKAQLTDNVNSEFNQFAGMDIQDIADHLSIDYKNLTNKSYIVYPDSKAVYENIYLYKDNSTYLQYLGNKINGKDKGKAYYLQRTETNHDTGLSNENNFYHYIRYNNEKYYRPDTKDVFYKTDKFEDDFFIKDENLFYEQLAKSYNFEYSFPVTVFDKSFDVSIFTQNDSHVAVLFDQSKHVAKAWFINTDGIVIATDLSFNEEASTSVAEEWFKEEIAYARERVNDKK